MDLRKLRHVVELANQGSYARAADALGLTQSALTRSIQSVEQELGLRLFDRGRSGVSATPAGRQLAREASELMQRARTLERNMALLANGAGGNVAFGTGPLAASVILPGLLTQVARDNRGLRVRTRLGSPRQLLAALKADELEFVILSRALVDPATDGVSIQSIGWLQLVALARPGHPLAGRRVTDAALEGLPVIGGTPLETDTAARRPDYEPTITCDNYDLLRSVVLETDAVWITADCLARGEFVVLEGISVAQRIQLVAASLVGRTLSPAARMLIDVSARQLASAGNAAVEGDGP